MARTTAVLARLTGNHQISIPKPIRDALGLKLGDFFEVRAERGVVVMRPKALEDKATLEQLKKDLEASKAAVKTGRVLGKIQPHPKGIVATTPPTFRRSPPHARRSRLRIASEP